MVTSKKNAWLAWFIAAVFYAYQYILRVMPNIMLNDIMQQFNINTAVFGQFSGFYYLGYCLMHLPIGILLDRYAPKKVMTGCILLTVIGLLPILFATHWIYPITGRFLIGAGSSAAILGTFKIIRMLFKEKHFTRMLSLAVTIGLIGAIYGGAPISYLCSLYGYKNVIKILVLLGLAFACITYLFVPDTNKKEHKTTIIKDLRTVLTNKKVILICLLAGLMVGPLEGFADAWGSEFLKQVYKFDAKTANYLTSIIYIGMCFAPVLSRIAEKTNRYFLTITGAGSVMLLIFALLIAQTIGYKSIIVGFFIVGICCSYQILAIYKASTYVPGSVASLTTAVTNMIIMSFGYIFHSSIGLIIHSCNFVKKDIAFTYGISILPITLLIGSLGFLLISFQEKIRRT